MPTFPSPASATVTVSIDPWARDLLEVQFALPMKNGAYLLSPEAYSITSLNGGIPCTVSAVMPGNEGTTQVVYLVVSGFTVGKLYSVAVANLYAVDGTIVAFVTTKFVGRTTKQDSIIQSRPQMYDTTPDAYLRKIINAVGKQDDLIGGSRNDQIITPPTPVVASLVQGNQPIYRNDTLVTKIGAGFSTLKFARLVVDPTLPVSGWRAVIGTSRVGGAGGTCRVTIGSSTSVVFGTASLTETIFVVSISNIDLPGVIISMDIQLAGADAFSTVAVKYSEVYAEYF